MARSAGYKINRFVAAYVSQTLGQAALTVEVMADVVFDLRAIMNKYQPREDILRDLQEVQAQATASANADLQQEVPDGNDD